MSDILTIEWQDRQIAVLEGHVQRSGGRVRGGFIAESPEGIDLDKQPVQAGEWLASELKKAGLEAKSVSVVLPREDAVLRRLELPDVPDEELPELVSMQAATVMSTPVDRLLIDFVPLPKGEASTTRSVLLASVVRERIDALRKALTTAGRELEHVGLAPVAIADLVDRIPHARRDDLDGALLIANRHGKRVDLSLVWRRCLVLAHTVMLHGENPSQDESRVLAEITRSLVPLQGVLGGRGIARACVANLTPALEKSLAERFHCSVDTLDIRAAAGLTVDAGFTPDARHAAVAGALLSTSGRVVESYDFLAPRRPPEKKDRTKQRRILIAAGVAAIALTGFALLKKTQWDLDAEIERVQKADGDLTRVLAKGEPVLKSAKIVRLWEDRRVDWLDHFQRVSSQLPGTSQAYFTDLRANPPATGDALARIRATGFAKGREDAEEVQRSLATEFRVYPQEIVPSTRDSAYPNKFEVEMDLLPPHKATAANGAGAAKGDAAGKATDGAAGSAAKRSRAVRD